MIIIFKLLLAKRNLDTKNVLVVLYTAIDIGKYYPVLNTAFKLARSFTGQEKQYDASLAIVDCKELT